MKKHVNNNLIVSFFSIFIFVGCGGGGGGDTTPIPPPVVQTTTVEFVYLASTEIDPEVAASQPDCVGIVGDTHIHLSWSNFDLFFLPPIPPTEFRRSFSDVPVGYNRIRISDPNVCAVNATGASIQNIYANGVLLSNVVDTPGNGIERGLSFDITLDGTVTP